MSFKLSSHIPYKAAISQYFIDGNDPINIGLQGPNSYCNLQSIQNPELKELLAKVGVAFEDQERCSFYNVHHTFTPAETSDSKDSSEINNQASRIFDHVKHEASAQSKDAFALDLSDLKSLVVSKGVDRSFLMGPHQAYEVTLRISDKAVEAAKNSGLVFKDYLRSTPPGTVAYHMGVGQKSIF